MSDAEVMRFWSSPPHETPETTRDWFAGLLDPVTGLHEFVIECDGQAIGKIGVWQGHEVGFILDRAAWGQGIASEALSAFVANWFKTADHLTTDVDPRNVACLRLIERHGFRETGRQQKAFFISGEYCDSLNHRLDRAG